MDATRPALRAKARFGAVAGTLLIAGVAGLTAVAAAPAATVSSTAPLIVLGAVTGSVSFFSPCSFPLLLTFLARPAPRERALASVVRVGMGAVAFFAMFGSFVFAVGTGVGNVLALDAVAGRALRGLVAGLLIVLGLAQSGVLRIRWVSFDRIAAVIGTVVASARRPGWVGDVAYGAGYVLAGFG